MDRHKSEPSQLNLKGKNTKTATTTTATTAATTTTNQKK